jgi:uncharacterized protein (DUF1778 family)
MASESTRFTDDNARLILPARFANSAVLVEEVSENELRVRKAVVQSEKEVLFTEEKRPLLSNVDRDLLLSLLDSPPEPTAPLKKAAHELRKRRG